METKEIKVRFENGKFVPIDRVSFKEGRVLEVVVYEGQRKKIKKYAWRGALKDLKMTSVELQHKTKEYW